MSVRYSGNATIRATFDPALASDDSDWSHRTGGAFRVTISVDGRVRWRGRISGLECDHAHPTVYHVALKRARSRAPSDEFVRPNLETVTVNVPAVSNYGRAVERPMVITRWAVSTSHDTYTDPPAFGEMLKVAAAQGLPRRMHRDLTVHDRAHLAILSHRANGGRFTFAWSLRDDGTHVTTDPTFLRAIGDTFGVELQWYVWTGLELRAVAFDQAVAFLSEQADPRKAVA